MDATDLQTDAAEIVAPSETQDNVEDRDENSARKRKLTSDVWNEFERITKTDGSQSAKCIHCRKQLVAGSASGTSHLRNHLARCNSKNKTGIAQYMIAKKKNVTQ